mgnify:CR=1 FL=1
MKGLWQLFAALYTIAVTNNNDAMFLLPSMDSMTIATVALRGYDPRPLLEGLRGQGEWTGRIIVFTDETQYSQALVDEFNVDLRPVELPPDATPLQAKLFKTMVLSPSSSSPNEASVLFIDADVEVNGPVRDFLANSPPHQKQLLKNCVACN